MDNEFSKQREGIGSREWSESIADFQVGCTNDCKYCYARDMLMAAGMMKERKEWLNERIRWHTVNWQWEKKPGVIMFPTLHDITPKNLDAAITFLTNMLKAGNKVLLVSKARPKCIETICQTLERFKDQILFRFTIGTTDDKVSKFWEPGAPLPGERIEALKIARRYGYQTSVNMEPMLGGADMAIQTYHAVIPHITDTVWIGTMFWSVIRAESTPENMRALQEIRHLQSDAEILRLVDALQDQPKVRWRHSIKEIISQNSKLTG